MLRTRHLACVLLLLSSIGAAQASTPAYGQFAFYGHQMAALLYRQSANAQSSYTPGDHIADRTSTTAAAGLPIAARASYAATWTMRPPAAHSAAVHAITGFGF